MLRFFFSIVRIVINVSKVTSHKDCTLSVSSFWFVFVSVTECKGHPWSCPQAVPGTAKKERLKINSLKEFNFKSPVVILF